MQYLNLTAGKMLVHIGIIPGIGQEQFLSHRLRVVPDKIAQDVIVMHSTTLVRERHRSSTFWPKSEGLWDPGVLKQVLAAHPRLVMLPSLSIPALSEEEHSQYLENIVTLLKAGVAVETSLSMLEVARVDDMLEPKTKWPEHAAITGDFLRRNVADYQVHDVQPQELMARFYRGNITIPEPLKDDPTKVFNLGNLNRLREIMLRFVNSHFTDVARQTNPAAQIHLPLGNNISLRSFLEETLVALAANGSLITLIHILWSYISIPFTAVGLLMLAAPAATSLYVNPITSIISAVTSFFAFKLLFIPGPFAQALTDPGLTITLMVFLVVSLGISYLSNRQHIREQQSQEQLLLLRSLLRLVYDLNYAETTEAVAEAGVNNLYRALNLQATVLDRTGNPVAGYASITEEERAAALRTMEDGSITPVSKGEGWIWCPLSIRRVTMGALGIKVGSEAHGTISWGTQSLIRAHSDMMANAMRRMELREATDSASQEAEREGLRATLLSSVSHDLKTPLVSIIGSLSTLRRMGNKLSEKDRRELVVTASEEAERLHSIIHNVLELTQLETGHVQPHIAPTDVGGIIETLRTRFHRYHPRLAISVAIPVPLPDVNTDGLLLEQVIYNVIDNAAKYAGEETSVEITGTAEPEHLTLRIADHGPGIPGELREKVFDKYFRFRQKDSRTAGSGLGLAISRAIVEACRGHIRIEGREDGQPGTVVVIELPYAEPEGENKENKL